MDVSDDVFYLLRDNGINLSMIDYYSYPFVFGSDVLGPRYNGFRMKLQVEAYSSNKGTVYVINKTSMKFSSKPFNFGFN